MKYFLGSFTVADSQPKMLPGMNTDGAVHADVVAKTMWEESCPIPT